MTTKQKSPPKAATLTANVNTSALLTRFHLFFGKSTSWIGELLQNARRARASSIDVTSFTGDDNLPAIAVEDNGDGITNWDAVLTLASSGWAEDIQKNEQPFGMGMFAAFAAAKRVEIFSKGKVLKLTMEDLAGKTPLNLISSNEAPAKGTRLKLYGVCFSDPRTFAEKLAHFAAGFPVPICFNGKQQAQPHAQGADKGLAFDACAIGFIASPRLTELGVHSEYAMGCTRAEVATYLCGLPVFPMRGHNYARHVVHLDPLQFTARMPDRDVLLNSGPAEERIHHAIQQHVASFLIKEQAAMHGRDFVQKYWQTCITYGCAELLARTPYIPVSSLYRINALSVGDAIDLYQECGASDFGGKQVLSRDDLNASCQVWTSGPSFMPRVCDAESDTASYNNELHLLSIADAQGVLFCPKAPPGHWLNDDFPSFSDFKAVCAAAPRAGLTSVKVACGGMSFDVRLVDSISLELRKRATDELVDSIDMAHAGLAEAIDGDTAVLYVTKASDAIHWASAFNNWNDEFDSYQEDLQSREENALLNAISACTGGHIATHVRASLCEGGFYWGHPTQQGQFVLVGIDSVNQRVLVQPIDQARIAASFPGMSWEAVAAGLAQLLKPEAVPA